MLTAAPEVVERVIGLEIGADEYATMPFEPRELQRWTPEAGQKKGIVKWVFLQLESRQRRGRR